MGDEDEAMDEEVEEVDDLYLIHLSPLQQERILSLLEHDERPTLQIQSMTQ